MLSRNFLNVEVFYILHDFKNKYGYNFAKICNSLVKNHQNPLVNKNTRVPNKRTSEFKDLGARPFWVVTQLQVLSWKGFSVKNVTSDLRWRLRARLFSSLAATPVLAMPLQDSWITWWVRKILFPFKHIWLFHFFGKPQAWNM